MQSKGVALRKRTQIAMANRVMFLWVAGVSIVFGFALVGTIFLTQILLFNERVIQEKERTVATLKANNINITELKSQIKLLDTNQALMDSKVNSSDHAVQVILDALPSDYNPLALGASIQTKLLAGIPNLTLNSLPIDTATGAESSVVQTALTNSNLTDSQNEIKFSFSVVGDDAALKQVLHNLEISIRTIDVISLKIEGQGTRSILSVQARAFYEPAQIMQLKDMKVK